MLLTGSTVLWDTISRLWTLCLEYLSVCPAPNPPVNGAEATTHTKTRGLRAFLSPWARLSVTLRSHGVEEGREDPSCSLQKGESAPSQCSSSQRLVTGLHCGETAGLASRELHPVAGVRKGTCAESGAGISTPGWRGDVCPPLQERGAEELNSAEASLL